MGTTSLPYEILLYLNSYYFGLFALAEVATIIFKALNLPYPTPTLIVEMLILVLLACTEASRIFMGRKGNLTEKAVPVLISLTLTVPSVLATIYLLIWQTYVLRVEVVMCWIQLVLQGLHLGFSLLFISNIYRGASY